MTCHSRCSKLSLLKVIILVKKQHLRNFEQSNVGNESKWTSKNLFLSCALCISVKESNFQNWPLPIFKNMSAQMHSFAWKTTFLNFSALKYLQWCPAGTQHSEDVPLWSFFGRDVPNLDRTKIGRIRFLTYFDSAMSDLHLASRNMEQFP